MSRVLFAASTAAGAVLGLLGAEPLWGVAIGALLVFPLATGAALRERGASSPPLIATLLAGLAGGVLIALALRLAVAAPGWLNETQADCGGPSTGTQQAVLWASAVVFAASSLPIGVILAALGRRLAKGDGGVPLAAYPVAVAAAGVALVAAAFVTNC